LSSTQADAIYLFSIRARLEVSLGLSYQSRGLQAKPTITFSFMARVAVSGLHPRQASLGGQLGRKEQKPSRPFLEAFVFPNVPFLLRYIGSTWFLWGTNPRPSMLLRHLVFTIVQFIGIPL
jgi:hypothetical protein